MIGSIAMLYNQVEEFGVDTGPLEMIELTRSTDIEIRAGYESENGEVKLSIANTGDRAVNFESEMGLYIDEVDYQSYSVVNEEYISEEAECVEELRLDIGETTSDVLDRGCKVGLDFPGAFDEPIELEIRHVNSHKTWSYTCDRLSSKDSVC